MKTNLFVCIGLLGILLATLLVSRFGYTQTASQKETQRGTRQSVIEQADRASTREEKEKVLGKDYVPMLALKASFDMRVLLCLRSNNVEMAKALLLQDLDISVWELSQLGGQMGVTDQERRILEQGQKFLKEAKGQ